MENGEKRISPRKLKYPAYYQKIKRPNLTFYSDEYARVEKAAQRYGKRPTTFMKESIIVFLDDAIMLPADVVKALYDLKVQVFRNGNLLNQIAARMNATQKRLIFDPLEAKKKTEKLIEAMEETLKYLTKQSGFSGSQQKKQKF